MKDGAYVDKLVCDLCKEQGVKAWKISEKSGNYE
jgi:hypothetical protein